MVKHFQLCRLKPTVNECVNTAAVWSVSSIIFIKQSKMKGTGDK